MTKLIGFDATEDHRTFAGGDKLSIYPMEGLPDFRARYDVRYPLREWGLDREACGKIIVDAGLPLPPKSACGFCPAMRQIEIAQLKREDPDMYALSIEMERRFRNGRHFRGDNFFTVKAERKDTGEKYEEEIRASDKADAREQFRQAYDDTVRPYKFKVAVHPAVVGLGRNFAWQDVEV